MADTNVRAEDRRIVRNDSPDLFTRAFTSPLLWGAILTLGFYALIPRLPVYRDLAIRYFCSHPLEYATAALFFLGIATLLLKAVRISQERAALETSFTDESVPNAAADFLERADRVEAAVMSLPRPFQKSLLARRIRDVCAFVRGRQSHDGLEEHLKYLAQLSAERLHQSYALVRTISWAVPILGFLGTVMGITLAIANVTPDQLDSSLGDVTGGLAIAFDTTALALTLSMVLVFTWFAVERSEERILAGIEAFGINRLANLFPAKQESQDPLLNAQTRAAQHLIDKTESLINWQTQLWQDSMESLRKRWMQTLAEQQAAFDTSLKSGMATTLADHSDHLASIRQSLVQGYQSASEQLLDRASAAVSGWQAQLKQSSDAINGQAGELKSQGETLLRIVEQEENLTRLQHSLADNLDTIQTSEKFEETLHSLTAAVHLLTARANSKAA